jgi:hypothetical protein
VSRVFADYAVGFVAHPIGATIFGHYGDRIIATAFLPDYATRDVSEEPQKA